MCSSRDFGALRGPAAVFLQITAAIVGRFVGLRARRTGALYVAADGLDLQLDGDDRIVVLVDGEPLELDELAAAGSPVGALVIRMWGLSTLNLWVRLSALLSWWRSGSALIVGGRGGPVRRACLRSGSAASRRAGRPFVWACCSASCSDRLAVQRTRRFRPRSCVQP